MSVHVGTYCLYFLKKYLGHRCIAFDVSSSIWPCIMHSTYVCTYVHPYTCNSCTPLLVEGIFTE